MGKGPPLKAEACSPKRERRRSNERRTPQVRIKSLQAPG
jgi:hypothetical protein